MFDFQELSTITNLPEKKIRSLYENWLKSKNNRNGTIVPDLKLLSVLSSLSTATVSHYINKKGGISRKNANKLQRIIDCVNYIPSSAAQRLRSVRKNSIAFVAPVSNSPNPSFYIEILKGVKAEAKKFGFSVDIYDIEENGEIEFFQKSAFTGMVDGLITVSMDLENKNLESLTANNLPVVNIHSWSKPAKLPVIHTLVPQTSVFRDLLEYLFQKKHFKQPVLISLHPKHHMVRNQKINYYTESLKENNIIFNREKHIRFISRHSISEAQSVYRSLSDESVKPDVFICLSDIVATGICRELMKNNSSAAVTGHDNSEIGKLFDLTTIDQKMYQTGCIAFEKIYMGIQYIAENKCFPEYSETQLRHELIIRDSTADIN